jgi:hypothetical protein
MEHQIFRSKLAVNRWYLIGLVVGIVMIIVPVIILVIR